MAENFNDKILEILSSNKIKNVEVLDLVSKSSLMHTIILGNFSTDKNTRMVANEIRKQMEEEFKIEINMEGEFPGDWIILDLGECLVELFTEDKRNYYNLEKLWGDHKRKFGKLKPKRKNKTA